MSRFVDLDSLRLLLLLDEHGSLGSAARELGVSQPAVSARLRSLESRYGLSLVRRSARGSTLTEDGKAVTAWARNVMNEVANLEAGIDALSAVRHGDIEIAASLTVAEYFAPRWLGELPRVVPDVHVGLTVVNSSEVVSMVRDNRVALGFIESSMAVPDLRQRKVGTDRVVVVVSPEHRWARAKAPISVTELRATPLVVRERGSGTRETFERALGAPPSVVLAASTTNVIVGAALNGVGPAVVSEVAVRRAVLDGQLVEVPVDLDLHRTLRAVWRRGERLHSPFSDLLTIAARQAR